MDGACLINFLNPEHQEIRSLSVLPKLEKMVGDYNVADHRRWCRPYETGKAVPVHAEHSMHEVMCLS